MLRVTDVRGQIRVWCTEREFTDKKGKKRSFLAYSSSIGTKNEDGSWNNLYYDVRFSREALPEIEDGESILLEVEDGWWDVKAYNGNKMLYMFINKAMEVVYED